MKKWREKVEEKGGRSVKYVQILLSKYFALHVFKNTEVK